MGYATPSDEDWDRVRWQRDRLTWLCDRRSWAVADDMLETIGDVLDGLWVVFRRLDLAAVASGSEPRQAYAAERQSHAGRQDDDDDLVHPEVTPPPF